MAFRRKRRNRGTWLPLDPTILDEGGDQEGSTVFVTSVTPPGDVGIISDTTVVPVAFDITRQTPNNVVTSDMTMRDLTEGQDYFLDRIVGKIFANLENNSDTNVITQLLVCAAFAVLPVQDDGVTVGLANQDINPLFARNTMAPYIWRRTWNLFGIGTAGSEFNASKPDSIAQYGSVMDGGHVDAKTKRRIRQNERLFFMLSMLTLETVGAPGTLGNLLFGFDVRLHGQLRRNRNTSSFR